MKRAFKKKFRLPRHSSRLAEFIGILLGDGGITNAQAEITLDALADREYIDYVANLAADLFACRPKIYQHHTTTRAKRIVIAGVVFIDLLKGLGLGIGDKVKRQVDVPIWVKEDKSLSKSCLRGLMDTDGGIFRHSYFVNGKRYSYLKLCFSNRSQPLRRFVHMTLSKFGFTPKLASNEKHVWLYSEKETRRYVQVIGTSNYRLLKKFKV